MNCSIYEIDFTKQLNLLDSASFVYTISQSLINKKRKCWISGGAVRDLLLGRTPADIDLVTDASEDEIIELFPKALLVGRNFGVYKLPFTLNERNLVIDLTIFREEDEYVDGRRPQKIKRSTPVEDAKRRDFTVNALFYDLENHQILDFVGGVNDLHNKILRCVGHADRRFKEDHLRLLRLTRFKAQFGFRVLEEDLTAAHQNVNLIQSVSGERIADEIMKVLKSNSVHAFWQQDLTIKLWKELGAEFHPENVADLEKIKNLSFSVAEQFALMIVVLWNYDSESVQFLKTRLKVSKDQLAFAKKIIDLKKELSKNPQAIDLAIYLDKDSIRQDCVKLLKFFEVYNDVVSFFIEFPKPLIRGGDLKGHCEPSQIPALLQKVRQAQFEKKIRTSDEALIFLKNLNLIY